MSHPLPCGKRFRSPGGSFAYQVLGPCCPLYDREELPWPCCSLQWKGKQPSWNRIGPRFIADIGSSRCPSYSVTGIDIDGNTWSQVFTMYYVRLTVEEKHWWYTKKPACKEYPLLDNP